MRPTVSPERAPIDEPVAVRLEGLAPGARVTVRARMEGYGNGIWASEAAFTADPERAAIAAVAEADGPIITWTETNFLLPTAFSPLR